MTTAALRRATALGILLTSACTPVYALGDMVIPGVAAMVVGIPLVILLFSWVWTTANNVSVPGADRAWEIVASGSLFSIAWLAVLIALDSDTWNGGINKTSLFLRYVVPLGVGAVVLVIRGRLRRALVLLASCVVVYIIYLLKGL